jgi:hypothetical protein
MAAVMAGAGAGALLHMLINGTIQQTPCWAMSREHLTLKKDYPCLILTMFWLPARTATLGQWQRTSSGRSG